MFTKKVQETIFNSIIEQSKKVIKKELNERAEKLEDTYKSIRYSTDQNLLQDASVNVDANMNINVSLELNKNIPFKDTERQNIPIVLERGGGIEVEGGRPAQVGGKFLKNYLGVKI
jgi:predicted RND superfamily exporter protein